MAAKRNASSKTDSTANLGFETVALRVTEPVRCGVTSAADGWPKRERGGARHFYNPTCLVEMLARHPCNRVYDPACGSGGKFDLPA